MSTPTNILQQVQTYQMAELALLLNYGCWIHTFNKKFNNFQNLIANLGSTVTYDLPPRFTTVPSLVAQFQGTTQRVRSLTVDQELSSSYSFTSQQMLYNVMEYMDKLGRAAVAELAAQVEQNVGTLAETIPYRFYGNGVDPINSYGQLASALAQFRTYGTPQMGTKFYLSDIQVPQIVNTGLASFIIDRNNEGVQSWMVGNWMGVDYYQTNTLPIHIAGTVGNNAQLLTVVSTNDPTGANITQIKFSGATANDVNAIKKYDNFTLNGQYYLTFIGHFPSAAPVQFQATESASADGSGDVVVSVTPVLCSQVGNQNQNLTNNIVEGMTANVLPSHKCGLIIGGDAGYLAMPQLPDQSPYATASTMDEHTGASIRLTYGAQFGLNNMGFINDLIWGKDLVPEYCQKVVLPLTQ